MDHSQPYTFILCIVLVFFVFIIVTLTYRIQALVSHQRKQTKFERCPVGQVCLTRKEYEKLAIRPIIRNEPVEDIVRQRDLRVLNDPLYPAINRTDSGAFQSVAHMTHQRMINVPTSHMSQDTYRLVGYLSNDDDKTSSKWKVFGRQKDNNRGEFYLSPVDKTIDMKVQITDDMISGSEKLRSVDMIPNQIQFKTPLLSDTPYLFTELPKGNLGDGPYL
jgi:hypothetical protein